MSIQARIQSLLEQGMLCEFSSSGSRPKLGERVILISGAVRSLFTPYRVQNGEIVQPVGYGVLNALQRLNTEKEIVVGERSDFRDEKGKPVLMKRLECDGPEIWELRVFEPVGMRVFGCFLTANKMLFTHGASKKHCDSEKKYLFQINLAHDILRELGVNAEHIYQGQPIQDYLSI